MKMRPYISDTPKYGSVCDMQGLTSVMFCYIRATAVWFPLRWDVIMTIYRADLFHVFYTELEGRDNVLFHFMSQYQVHSAYGRQAGSFL